MLSLSPPQSTERKETITLQKPASQQQQEGEAEEKGKDNQEERKEDKQAVTVTQVLQDTELPPQGPVVNMHVSDAAAGAPADPSSAAIADATAASATVAAAAAVQVEAAAPPCSAGDEGSPRTADAGREEAVSSAEGLAELERAAEAFSAAATAAVPRFEVTRAAPPPSFYTCDPTPVNQYQTIHRMLPRESCVCRAVWLIILLGFHV